MYKVVDKESRIVNVQLQSKGMQKLLKDDKADYFIVPWVRINSADLTSIGHEIMGNVANQIAHPESILPMTMTRTFKDRIFISIYVVLMNLLVLSRVEKNYDLIVNKYFPKNTKSVRLTTCQ